jgi:hypothetical protein
MDTKGAVIIGAQRPALWTAPPRHRSKQDGCGPCDNSEYRGGCGNHVAEEVLDWAVNYWDLDDWQDWYLTEGLGVKPSQRFAATDTCLIVPRQNGKGTTLEVRELGGLFVLNEKKIIHTAHQFSTAKEHFDRCLEVIDNNADLSKWLLGLPSKTHGLESISLKAKPTIIFAARGSMVRKSFIRKLEFHARTGKKSRGFTCNCLVYDESMYLTGEQIGASRPTLRAVANHQIWLAGSAGMVDSLELASYHDRLVDDEQTFVGAEWGGLTMHKPSCPRDKILGRKTNDYVVNCTEHDDRDSEYSWAKSNPAYGTRIEKETFENEIVAMRDIIEFNRELLNVGEWPDREAAWKVIDRDLWDSLSVKQAGTLAPVAIGVDVDEDGKSSAIGVCWQSADGRLVVKNPAGCVLEGTDDLIPTVHRLYDMIRKQFGPVIAIVVPRDGPAAGIGDDLEKKYRDKVIRATSQDQAAAFAFFTQKCKETPAVIAHAPKEVAADLYAAVGGSETRDIGDGGKTWKRRDATVQVSPATTCTLAAWIFNKLRRNYDLLKSFG